MYKVGINFDEISDNLDEAIAVMLRNNVQYGELRTIAKKNFVFWDDKEIQDFKTKITASGIRLVAAATPLFKWYDNESDPEISHDSFGFNPRLSDIEKRRIIDKTLTIADQLNIPRLRIFSGLGTSDKAGIKFANSELLAYALQEADKRNLDLFLENEPVCKIHTKNDIVDLLENNTHTHLKLWLDIANLVELKEEINTEFIQRVKERLSYIHVKDFIVESGKKAYTVFAEGKIPYNGIMKLIYSEKSDGIDITVETHAQINKITQSERSILGLRKVLKEQGVEYE